MDEPTQAPPPLWSVALNKMRDYYGQPLVAQVTLTAEEAFAFVEHYLLTSLAAQNCRGALAAALSPFAAYHRWRVAKGMQTAPPALGPKELQAAAEALASTSPGSRIVRYEGTCDVCHEPISTEFDWENDGIIDHAFTDEGRQYTWIRHYSQAPEGANPACAIYSSAVYEVPSTEERRVRCGRGR